MELFTPYKKVFEVGCNGRSAPHDGTKTIATNIALPPCTVKTQELILCNLWLFFFLYEKFITHALCFPFRGILLWERRWLSGGKSVVWLPCQHTVPPDATWTNGTAPLHLLISACLAVCSLPAVLSPAHHIWAETWVNTKKSQISMLLSPSHLFMFMISLTIGVYCEACLS